MRTLGLPEGLCSELIHPQFQKDLAVMGPLPRGRCPDLLLPSCLGLGLPCSALQLPDEWE